MTTLGDGENPQHVANITRPRGSGKVDVFSDTSKNKTWIIDTGASDHMTNDSNKLLSIRPSSQSTSPIMAEGHVILSNLLKLDSVLVVPSLEYNLLSVSQITLSLNCSVSFWPTFCIFQDILTRKTLGYGVKRDKLYYLELTAVGEHRFGHACQTGIENRVKKAREIIWLWHRRLGHLSFGYLKELRPKLFS
jgi:hypothetical protein